MYSYLIVPTKAVAISKCKSLFELLNMIKKDANSEIKKL